jgi:hypothetical protein
MGWPPELNTCVHDKYSYEHCEACARDAAEVDKRIDNAKKRERMKKAISKRKDEKRKDET